MKYYEKSLFEAALGSSPEDSSEAKFRKYNLPAKGKVLYTNESTFSFHANHFLSAVRFNSI